jgi:virginiamycin B lyase
MDLSSSRSEGLRAVAVAGVVVTVVLGLLALLPVAADAYVYWSNNATGTIGRANLDGSASDQEFITGAGAPSGVDVDSNYVYWANGGSIGRANIDGTGVDPDFIPLAGFSATADVKVNGTHIYWSSFQSGSIGRANLDGSGAGEDFIDVFTAGGANPNSLALSPTNVYWANSNPGSIGRANLDGSDPVGAFGGFNYLTGGVAVNGSHLFYSHAPNMDDFPYTTYRSNLDGSGQVAILFLGSPSRLDLDESYLYWSAFGTGVGRAGLDGSGPDPEFITGGSLVAGVAVDDAATAEPDPSALAFGVPRAIAPGTVSAPQSVTLTNRGGRALEVGGFSITGPDAGGFATTTGTCGPPVPPGGSCAVQVRFTPDSPGSRSASLRVITNAPTDPVIALTGEAGDTVPPDTSIQKGPRGRSRDRTPTFVFRSSEPGSTFICRIDRKPFRRCPAVKTFRVKPGRHVVRVKARDAAGNLDPTPAKRAFTVLR